MIRLLLMFALLMAGCSSLRVSHDFDPSYRFAQLKRFAVLTPQKKYLTLDEARIAKAIEETLVAKGYRPVSRQRADFYVLFHIGVTTHRQIVTDYEMADLFPYRCCCAPCAVVPTVREEQWREAKIVVDIVTSKEKKVIWRAVATDHLHHFKTPQARRRYIREVVSRLLKNFPPKGTS